jgi:hypothetical protein
VRAALVWLIVAAPAAAQRPAPDISGHAGYGCFVDEAFCDLPHFIAGASARLYFSRRWAFEPEFSYMRSGADDQDYVLTPNLTVDFGKDPRVRPYAIFGAGLLYHKGRFASGSSWTFGGGFGVKVYVSRNVFVSPEVRLGWEPFVRLGAGVGYAFSR